MDQALKERLIGAAVLVALGVWLIPLLLDGPDDGAEDGPVSLQLPIPDVQSDAPVRTQVVDLNAARRPQSAVIAVDQTSGATRNRSGLSAAGDGPGASAGAAVTDVEAGSDAAMTRASSDSAVAGKPERDTGSASAAVGGTAASAGAGSVSGVSTGTSSGGEPSARSAEPVSPGDWAIQLGSFGEEENARRLAERVSGYGFEPRISNFRAGGRTMYRVRIGPHATREAAEAAASSLSAHGFVAQVVTVD